MIPFLFLICLPAIDPSQFVGKVDGQVIHLQEVDREVKRALKGRSASPEVVVQLRSHALEQLIRRRLVLQYLNRQKGFGASSADIDLRVEQIRRKLESRQRTLDQYLQQTKQTLAELRHRLAWEIAWPLYVEQQLTDEALEKFFQKRRRDFDGTQLRVSHMLLAMQDGAAEAALARAEAICQDIRSGKVTFADAAREHSTAPSAAEGGDIGFISRHDPMPEDFSQVAFELKENAVSDPVVSDFGVHIIQCTAIQPGDKTWQKVHEPLTVAAAEHLFLWIVEREAPRATIERQLPNPSH